MEKRKLTKEQIEKRNILKNKIKTIGLIASLVFNAFFITMCSVGCASDNGNNEVFAAQRNERNNKVQNLDYYNSTYAYYIGPDIEPLYNQGVNYSYTDLYVSLGSTYVACVRDVNDSVVMLDEAWRVSLTIHATTQVGDSIRLETPNFTFVWQVQNNGAWALTTNYSPENYYYNEIYLPVNLSYNASNYQTFRSFMGNLFPQVRYKDYELQGYWSPISYFSSPSDSGILYGDEIDWDLVVDNPVNGTSFKILDNTLFSINGYLYTDLLVHIQEGTISTKVELRNVHTSTGINVIGPNVHSINVIDYVYAYNNSTERTTTIWRQDFSIDSENQNYWYLTFRSGAFINTRLSNVRLFYRHLDRQVLDEYTNGNVLGVGNPNNDYEDVGIFDSTFNLFTSAFVGLNGLFNITILPGITIGMLLFLPLIGIIVFAIIRIIKK